MFNKKKKHFKAKADYIQKQIWEIEFKLTKSRQLREEIRQQRDRYVEIINQIEEQLKNIPKDQKELVEKQKKEAEDNKAKYEQQMAMIDIEVNGQTGTPDQTYVGLSQQLENHVEHRRLVLEHIKSL